MKGRVRPRAGAHRRGRALLSGLAALLLVGLGCGRGGSGTRQAPVAKRFPAPIFDGLPSACSAPRWRASIRSGRR